MKVAAGTTKTHNPFDEDYRASCLRENLTSSSYGEGLETGRDYTQEPRQSFTRQNFFSWWKRHLRVYHLIARSCYGLMVQILAGLITYLLLAIYCHENHGKPVTIKRVRELRIKIQNELRIAEASANSHICKNHETQQLHAKT
jgi:hypothetical protein